MTTSSFHLIPPSASTFATRLDALTLSLILVSALLTATVFGLVVYFGLRYHRVDPGEVPAESAHSNAFEIVVSVGLFGLFMGMFLWGVGLYVDMRRPPASALAIDVIGKQWMWNLQHPGGQRENNELHVPVGRPVRLTMTSLDVIHSFGVPAFRIKQDVVPGAYTTQWFTATKPGVYDLFCQEYCGTDHLLMRGHIVALEEKDYDAWLAGTPADDSPAKAGAKLFVSYGCGQCHGQNGPTLAGVYGRVRPLDDGTSVIADETYLRDSILNPASQIVAGYGHLMPSYRGQLSEEQVQQLVQYLKSLGRAVGDATTADAALPATRPVTDVATPTIPNLPPARQPPAVRQTTPGSGGVP